MSLLLRTVVFYFVLIIFYHFNNCSSTGTRPLFQLNGDIAKSKFCKQKYFDAVSFDGKNYRFSVNRRDIARDRITFELFLLNYNETSDSFHYSSATFDNDNVVLGGFYLQQKSAYVEFLKNAKKEKEVSVCIHKFGPVLETECTRLDDIDKSQIGRLILYPKAINFLKNGMPCAFAYDAEQEKIIYIFSDQKTPIIFNSLRTFSSQKQQNSWFTKSFDNYKMNKFVGSFNWPNGGNHSSIIFLLAQSQWKRTNLTLFELPSLGGKFVLKRVTSPWQEFFGCYLKVGHSQLLRQSSESAGAGGGEVKSGHRPNKAGSGRMFNVFPISLLALFALLIAIALLAVVHNVKLFSVKRLCQCPLFPLSTKTHLGGVGGST